MRLLTWCLTVGCAVIIGVSLLATYSVGLATEVWGPEELLLIAPTVMATETRYTSEIVENVKEIPFKTVIEYNSEKDACGDGEIKQEGKDGKVIKQIEVNYYDGEEVGKQIIKQETQPPEDEIIVKGLRKSYQSMQTDSGTITYWCKLGTFTATAYDASCPGCDGRTAIGLKAGFGVVAVDRTVIPLGSQLYITGYGKAIAGDTGGSIKGKRIDLGFDSIGRWWGRRDVEVYLL